MWGRWKRGHPGTGDTSREIGDFTKSCVRTASVGFTPSRGSRPLPIVGPGFIVPGVGETPRLDTGDPPPKVRDSGNEMVGFALIFSLLPPNLNKPTLLGLRCDKVEVEVGREVGIETSLEWDEVVMLCVSSASSAAAFVSRAGFIGFAVEEDAMGGEGFDLELGLGYELGGFGEREDTDGLSVDVDTGGVALVVAYLAAIGGKGTSNAEAEAGPEAEPGAEEGPEVGTEGVGVDVDIDADEGRGMVGIGGTTGVGFDFRLKNDGDFFGLPESEV